MKVRRRLRRCHDDFQRLVTVVRQIEPRRAKPAGARYRDRAHDALLRELGASGECFVVWPVFPGEPAPANRRGAILHGAFWRTVDNADYLAEPAEISVESLAFPSTTLHNVFRAVADEDAAEVTLGPDDLDWLYHPYDGGADVIARSPADRNRLRRKFEGWLPTEPTGL